MEPQIIRDMDGADYHADRLTPEELSRVLICDPDAGKLFWRVRTPDMFNAGRQSAERACKVWNTRYANGEAFTAFDRLGYRRGAIFYRNFLAHRVIFAMTAGRWPAEFVDHINGNPADNRFANLREATQAQNKANAGPRGASRPYIGVFRGHHSPRWCASIYCDGRPRHVGTFDTAEEAARARDAASVAAKGEFARLNFPKSEVA